MSHTNWFRKSFWLLNMYIQTNFILQHCNKTTHQKIFREIIHLMGQFLKCPLVRIGNCGLLKSRERFWRILIICWTKTMEESFDKLIPAQLTPIFGIPPIPLKCYIWQMKRCQLNPLWSINILKFKVLLHFENPSCRVLTLASIGWKIQLEVCVILV